MHSCRSPRKAGWLSMPHPGGPQTPRGGAGLAMGSPIYRRTKAPALHKAVTMSVEKRLPG